METRSWIPGDVDVTKPSPARVYDYFLGGSHNFEADRAAAERITAAAPQDWRMAIWVYRRFLRRAVRHCLDAGVTQFLDLGSGLPTVANVHETAQNINPNARVVYVDIDSVAYKHCELLLETNPNATAVHADLRYPEHVMNDPETTRLLDFTQPVAVIMAAVLHFIPDSDDPGGIIQRYTDRLTADSYLVITHGSDDGIDWGEDVQRYRSTVSNLTSRSRAGIEAFFTGFELIEPGVAFFDDWPHDPNEVCLHDLPARFAYAGIGRKP